MAVVEEPDLADAIPDNAFTEAGAAAEARAAEAAAADAESDGSDSDSDSSDEDSKHAGAVDASQTETVAVSGVPTWVWAAGGAALAAGVVGGIMYMRRARK